MMVLVKVADISNEARPTAVAEPWLDCLLKEFFSQVTRPDNRITIRHFQPTTGSCLPNQHSNRLVLGCVTSQKYQLQTSLYYETLHRDPVYWWFTLGTLNNNQMALSKKEQGVIPGPICVCRSLSLLFHKHVGLKGPLFNQPNNQLVYFIIE